MNGLLKGEEIEQLFLEFDERKTPEAFFAYQCDKLECDLQSKLYDEEGCVNLKEQEGNQTLENKKVQLLLEQGFSWSEMWLRFGQETYPYDEHFREVSNYAMNHSLKKTKIKEFTITLLLFATCTDAFIHRTKIRYSCFSIFQNLFIRRIYFNQIIYINVFVINFCFAG